MANWKSGIGMGLSGAAAGTAVMPGIGTAIGGAAGLLGGLFGGGDDQQAPKTYDVKESSFAVPEGPPQWSTLFSKTAASEGASPTVNNAWNIGQARTQDEQRRAQYDDALMNLRARASGKNSIAQTVGDQEREKAARMSLSNAATMASRGGYAPGLARAAMTANGTAGAQIAGQTAVAAAQERQQAESAYLQAIGAGRGQDQNLMTLEQAQERQQQAYNLAMSQLAAQYTQIGLSDKNAVAAARMDLEKTKAGIVAGGNQYRYLADAANNQESRNQTTGIMSGLAGLANAYGQYRKANQIVAPSGNPVAGSNQGSGWWDWAQSTANGPTKP
jgi:hypothetical protein